MRKSITRAPSEARTERRCVAAARAGLRRLKVGLLLLTAPVIALTNGLAHAETITFIQLNDLHAHLTPHRDLVRSQSASGSPVAVIETLGGLVNKVMFGSEVQAPDYPMLGGNVIRSIWLIDDGEPLQPAVRNWYEYTGK